LTRLWADPTDFRGAPDGLVTNFDQAPCKVETVPLALEN